MPQGSLRIRDVARVKLIGTIALVPELRVQGAVSQSLKRWLRRWRPKKIVKPLTIDFVAATPWPSPFLLLPMSP